MQSILFSILLGSFAILVASGTEGPDSEDTIIFPNWVENAPSQPKYNIRGTPEQVIGEAIKTNPSSLDDYGLGNKARINSRINRDQAPAGRQDMPDSFTWQCDSVLADLGPIQNAIQYLSGLVADSPVNDPGSCSTVSCSHNSTIRWCNNSTEKMTLSSWKSVAEGAKAIATNCKSGIMTTSIGGVAFHPSRYSVIVERASC
ncbi:hypothetical protein GQ53DRAFT_811691 [Thozetella sp. PMI_491]|nr:hypothetical protein GQ53DRAFT_811691 [Thozetella sp. PMI_491]